jgi:hypothetical protein
MLKVLVFDVDGVLNTSPGEDEFRVEPRLVQNLNRVTRTTGAELVMSSGHRLGKTRDELATTLKQHGIEGLLLGKTPDFIQGPWDSSENRNLLVPRALEIADWLLSNISVVRRYAVIDNDDIFAGIDFSVAVPAMESRFVRTHTRAGLTDSVAEQLVAMLDRPVYTPRLD